LGHIRGGDGRRPPVAERQADRAVPGDRLGSPGREESRTVVSPEPDARVAPSGLKATRFFARSRDPNDKLSPAGYGGQSYTQATGYLDYQIRFENQTDAIAPAQEVVI